MSQDQSENIGNVIGRNHNGVTTMRNAIRVQVKVLNKAFWAAYKIGEYGSTDAAAFDIRACIDAPIKLYPGQQAMISTGLAVYLGDPNYTMLMVPRSGMGNKGLVLGNLTGLIDADYQGELQVSAWNRKMPSNADNWADRGRYAEENAITINPGDRIAQAFIVPVMRAAFEVVDEFTEATVRGTGGWGHSGIA